MKHFTIDAENNITIYGSAKEPDALPNSERFNNEAALAKLAANWPAARLAEIWNSLPGETPVRKFKDRATAVSRIWNAIQSLGEAAPAAAEEPATASEVAPVPEQEARQTVQPDAAIPASPESAPAAPVTPQSPDGAPEQPPAKKKSSRAKKAPAAATDASVPRAGSKTSQVIAMLRREGGSLTKKHGLVITSEKVGDQRRYSIKA
jgi:hypothetical protein